MEHIQETPKNSTSSSSSSSFFSCHEDMNPMEEEINTCISTSCFTCEICIEPVPLNQKFENECSHPFCIDCVAKYIQVKVEEDNTSEIKCPDVDCRVILDALSCRSILPHNVFEKWCRVLCESAVLKASSEGGFAHGRAYCPSRNCSELVLNECERSSNTRITRSNCPTCKNLFCFHCMVPWNENHQCDTRNGVLTAVDRNDVLFVEMVKHKKWTRCPTCNHYVELSRGCVFVKCRCKTLFCYSCGKNIASCVCRAGTATRCVECSIGFIIRAFIIFLFFMFIYWLLKLMVSWYCDL